ncbi:mitochondrial 54S ribosomal protein YmL33 [Eremomyces bilateralis CBS 781.70]|uniref:Large ribosomal subunit protein uL30m n=1 Tax=Eremomyces bilateralis CBS 781.70 TaxID=1392243 RepID=A0A6G1FZN5_9PEZI|nr:mitochondrial 54S ribosomal protein YmL33 [Eremomyces bilateralis CBS 781.70]KAF1811238.1 mitochondrial 54S ribosomal protein YmL33 [Eremomyces bilateralis CBS 781.70]
MAYFKITLMRSAIGLPKPIGGVLKSLGLRKRMATVYQPVRQDVAGKIMAVKELVDVQEVEKPLTNAEMRALRRPDPGFYVESRGVQRFDTTE